MLLLYIDELVSISCQWAVDELFSSADINNVSMANAILVFNAATYFPNIGTTQGPTDIRWRKSFKIKIHIREENGVNE